MRRVVEDAADEAVVVVDTDRLARCAVGVTQVLGEGIKSSGIRRFEA